MSMEIKTPPRKFLSTSDLGELQNTLSNVIEFRKFSFVGSHRNAHIEVNRLVLPSTQIFGVKSTTSIHVWKENLNSVQVAIPLKGSIRALSSGSEIYIMPGEALIHTAGDDLDDTWLKSCFTIFVHIESQVLTSLIRGTNESQNWKRCSGPHVIPLTHGLGRTMATLVHQICSEARQTNTEMITDYGIDKVLHYIMSLIVTQNRCTDTRDQLSVPVSGRHLDRAVDFVFSHLEHDISLDELAGASCVSARTLQRAFVSRFGMGPIVFIKRAKLNKVREELMDSSPCEKTVGAIASKWGFHHAGNFARIYSEIFHETPVQTLRQGRAN